MNPLFSNSIELGTDRKLRFRAVDRRQARQKRSRIRSTHRHALIPFFFVSKPSDRLHRPNRGGLPQRSRGHPHHRVSGLALPYGIGTGSLPTGAGTDCRGAALRGQHRGKK